MSVASVTRTVSVLAPGFRAPGDVEREGKVAAGVGAHLGVVDPDRGLVIHGLEVEQRALAIAPGRRLEAAAIPQGVLGSDALLDAGKGGLDGKRHENVAGPVCRRGGGGFRCDLVFPEAVEVAPGTAGEGRPGILLPGGFRGEFRSPFGEHGIRRGLPGLSIGGMERGQRRQQARGAGEEDSAKELDFHGV